TDKRVNEVTKTLFKKYRTPKDFADAGPEIFRQEIRSTGFYNSKAKNIINTSKIIVDKFRGRVPGTMEELLTLPGVARKTANVVLNNVFGKVEGVVVDTHVKRLSRRLGLSDSDDPVKIERDLMAAVPKRDWEKISYLLIDHGRAVCRAKNPDHRICVLRKICPSNGI
ncbi:MAG: endonuclease III, partial [Candidatus Omnitrophota bacterium]